MDYRVQVPPASSSGVRTLVQQLSGLTIHSPIVPTKLLDKNVVTINDSPRAGQWWEIQGAYFEFPNANKSGIFFGGSNREGEFELAIKLAIGGISVAKQIFVTRAPKVIEPGEKWPLVGNLEAFLPMVVYPGQNITITYELTFPAEASAFGEAITEVGKIVISYVRHGKS